GAGLEDQLVVEGDGAEIDGAVDYGVDHLDAAAVGLDGFDEFLGGNRLSGVGRADHFQLEHGAAPLLNSKTGVRGRHAVPARGGPGFADSPGALFRHPPGVDRGLALEPQRGGGLKPGVSPRTPGTPRRDVTPSPGPGTHCCFLINPSTPAANRGTMM